MIELDASNSSVVFIAPVIQRTAPGSQACHFSQYQQKPWSSDQCSLGTERGSAQREPSPDPGAGSCTSFLLEEGILWSVLGSLPSFVAGSFSSGCGILVC